MRLDCPSCAASFNVSPAALEPNGRTVRCAQCKTTWYAPAPRHALAMAEAEAEISSAPIPEVSARDREDRAARAAVPVVPDPVDWEDAELAEIKSPPLAPGAEPGMRKRARATPPRPRAKSRHGHSPMAALALILAATIVLGLIARQSIVRAAPETASLFAAAGFPVNLRGLEFRNVTVVSEMQDGVAVLAVSGEVESVAAGAIELPRVRLSVIGEGGNEIYAWTALLPRSIIYPRERVQFKSRLASPPPAGKELMVRFLTRGDLMAGIR